MKLRIDRYVANETGTIGKFFINDEFVCYTMEDPYHEVKIAADTRIPEGDYVVKFRNEGRINQNYAKRFPKIHKGMLHITNIPNYQYVMIHCGNTKADTEGCPLVGLKVNDDPTKTLCIKAGTSTDAYKKIYPIIAKALCNNEEVIIQIQTV